MSKLSQLQYGVNYHDDRRAAVTYMIVTADQSGLVKEMTPSHTFSLTGKQAGLPKRAERYFREWCKESGVDADGYKILMQMHS